MSSKSDRDNRANQLNPNNEAYDSSRCQANHRGDSDDLDCSPRPISVAEALSRELDRIAHNQWLSERERLVENEFIAAFVGMKGEKRLVRFQLVGKPFMGNRDVARAANEDFAELLVNEIGLQLIGQWKTSLALQLLFDRNGADMFWAGHEYPLGQRNGSARSDNDRLWELHGKSAVAEMRSLFKRSLSDACADAENWGIIEKLPAMSYSSRPNEFVRQVGQLISKHSIIHAEKTHDNFAPRHPGA